jgi:hypothetical protein
MSNDIAAQHRRIPELKQAAPEAYHDWHYCQRISKEGTCHEALEIAQRISASGKTKSSAAARTERSPAAAGE